MRYPTLAETPMSDLAKEFLGKEELGPNDRIKVESLQVYWGSRDNMDLRELEMRVKEMKTLHEELLNDPDYQKDPDRIEGRLSQLLHQGLTACRMPDEAMDDKGFWRYLVMKHFWWLVVWRHHTVQPERSKQFKAGGKYIRYLDHKKHEVSVLARMYIRADLARDGNGSYELAWAGKEATDVWQSHLIPVKTAYTPVLVRAFLRRQARQPLSTPQLRECAKDIKRSNTNVTAIDWADEDADAYIDHHWAKHL
jgi:hypothetical protein